MAQAVIAPRIRGFICTTAHSVGCARNVEQQIALAEAARTTPPDRYRVLVVGSSTGYGLSARVTATWGYDADTIGVFFERPPTSLRSVALARLASTSSSAGASRRIVSSASAPRGSFSKRFRRFAETSSSPRRGDRPRRRKRPQAVRHGAGRRPVPCGGGNFIKRSSVLATTSC